MSKLMRIIFVSEVEGNEGRRGRPKVLFLVGRGISGTAPRMPLQASCGGEERPRGTSPPSTTEELYNCVPTKVF